MPGISRLVGLYLDAKSRKLVELGVEHGVPEALLALALDECVDAPCVAVPRGVHKRVHRGFVEGISDRVCHEAFKVLNRGNGYWNRRRLVGELVSDETGVDQWVGLEG